MKALLIFFLSISTFCFAQKEYRFDYMLEYETTIYRDSVIKFKEYYLTNSKMNNYLAVLKEKDSLYYEFFLTDENGIHADAKILKTDFYKAEFINVDCNSVLPYQNPYKHKTKRYDFYNLKDTIINDTAYYHYKMQSNNSRREKSKKVGSEHYIVNKKTAFHLPILRFPTAYEYWKKKKNIPNGIGIDHFSMSYYNELVYQQKLINTIKIETKIIIPKECDYTK